MYRKKMLQGLVALGILAAVNAPAHAMQEEIFSYGGYDIFRVQYFDAADQAGLEAVGNNFWNDNGDACRGLTYSYNEAMKKSLKGAFGQWAEILYRNGENMIAPAWFIVGTSDAEQNAYAEVVVKNRGVDEEGNVVWQAASFDYFWGVFQKGFPCEVADLFRSSSECDADVVAYGQISIGKNMGANLKDNGAYYGWGYEPLNQQAQNESAVSFQPVIFHEIAHAIGILSSKYFENDSWNFDYLNRYDAHLVDERGILAEDGQIISYNQSDKDNKDVFYVQPLFGNALKADSTSGRAYFIGEHVSDVLRGNGENAKDFQGVDGIPVLVWENDSVYGKKLDLSHINLARSLMSHQNYRSYTAFIEAELALMQDVGYKIDRRNFFGRSIYSDGNGASDNPFKNTQGYFARNAAGTAYEIGKANTATLGIGLHIYGSGNNILQTDEGKGDGSADLLACGTGGAGIRIDGVCNTVAVDKGVTVSADGENGRGVLVAYGHDNKVVIDGTVTAAGAGGDGVRFDFGSNSIGGNTEYRGSYLRYTRRVDENGNITNSVNIPLNFVIERDSISEDDLAGPMGSLIVNGKLYGRDHAVYISKNAFVNNINVNGGARIKGDIVSDWKHFDNGLYDGGWGDDKNQGKKLVIQYGSNSDDYFYYDGYHKDLVTQLNFNGNTEMQGNIIGSDNMKMTVNSGTLRHDGSADVVNVKVNQGATLLGGSYKVNKIPVEKMVVAEDTETGIFYNKGTIGALTADRNFAIDGDLESSGKLLAFAGSKGGKVTVSGEVELQPGSAAEVQNGIAGEKVTILQAGKNVNNLAGNIDVQGSGLLNYSGAVVEDNKNLTARAVAKASLAGENDMQQRDYAAMNRNAASFIGQQGADGELRAFYALDSDAKALNAIDEIGTNNKEQGTAAVSAAQSSTLNNRVLSSRLATAFGQAPATLSIGGASLDEGDGMRVDIPVMLPQSKDETAWVKFTKNWGNTAGDSNYTGSAITVGYDWKRGEQQRNGWFASYNDTSYGHMDGSENVQDTRIGYYTGLNKGADTQLFYADFGYLDGERSRLVSINSLGTHNMVQGNYNGWIAEIGGEWKHALHAPGTKTWQVSPYGAMQLSYMKNHGYQEQGSIKAYGVEGGHNTYAAAEAGMEFTRFLPKGSLNFRLGVRQALMGADYQEQDASQLLERSYSKSSRMDRTHFVTSLAAETEFQPGWQLSTELGLQKGAHDKDIMASIQFRRLW